MKTEHRNHKLVLPRVVFAFLLFASTMASTTSGQQPLELINSVDAAPVWVSQVVVDSNPSSIGTSRRVTGSTNYVSQEQEITQVGVANVVASEFNFGGPFTATGQDQVVLTKHQCGRIEPVHVSADDEVWLVSARECHCAPRDLSRLRVSRLANGNWQPANYSDLVQQHVVDKSKATMVYVHGNRTDLGWAESRGLQFYQNAIRCSGSSRPPVRFVIFAWRSDAELPRLFPDFEIKAHRSVLLGQTLASMLAQFEDRNLLIAGFSLGSQVVLSGLSDPSLHAGGQPGRYQVAIIAPALDAEFVGLGLTQFPYNPFVEQTKVFRNDQDRAVKIAQVIARKQSNSSVTTFRQIAGVQSYNPISIMDVTREINRKHSIAVYGTSPTLRCELSKMLARVAFENQTNRSVNTPGLILGQ